MASARTGAALEIRKVRKKLRQIENLERLDRELTDDELNKILKKNYLRDNLLKLLAEHGEEESFTSSTRSEITDDGISEEQSFSYDNYGSGYHDNSVGGEVTVIEPEDETNTDMIDVDVLDDIENEEIIDKTTNATQQDIKPEVSKTEETFVSKTSKGLPEKVIPSPSKKSKKSEKTDEAKLEKPSKLKTTLHSWRFGHFQVIELEGHNDLVTDTDTDGQFLVTSSRDTTVKLWSVETLTELRNYGGHSGAVTCVRLLSQKDSAAVCSCLDLEEEQRILISGSYDCSLKIWSATTSGEAIRSVYTFNPVTKIIYHPVAQVIITGSDGGKLEVWDISTGESLQSVHPYEEAVTGLKVCDGLIYSSSAEGLISIHTLQEKQLNCLFVSESVRCENNGHLTQRHIRGFDVKNGFIYYGDDGTNLKVLDWKKGLVHKLVNHCEDFGVTDSICCHGDIMVSSAYSMDIGAGYVNVRYLPEQTYITTLNDEDTGRIVALSYVESGPRKIVVTAGMQLKVWITDSSINENEDVIATSYLPKLAHRHCQDSDMESDIETTDSDGEEEQGNVKRLRSHSRDSSQEKGWLSWCNII